MLFNGDKLYMLPSVMPLQCMGFVLAGEGDVIVVDKFEFEAPKTKLMAKFLKELGVDRTACIVQKDVDDTVVLVTSNLPKIDYSTAQAMDVYMVLANRKLVCDKAGFDALMARIAK